MKISEIVIALLKKMICNRGVSFDLHSRLSLSTELICEKSGTIKIEKGFHSKRNVTIHSFGGSIKIGENVFINENVSVVSHTNIKIGSNVTIGPNVMIYDHDHDFKKGNGFVVAPIQIDENVWIGAGAIILKGVTIGCNSVIAAGTIITKDIPPNSVVRQETILKVTSIK